MCAATNEPACLRSGKRENEAVPLGGQAPAPSCLVPEGGFAESRPVLSRGPSLSSPVGLRFVIRLKVFGPGRLAPVGRHAVLA